MTAPLSPLPNPTPDNYQFDQNTLKDKKILITGAGDGIGKTAALTFAQAGATVILLGRTQAKLEAVYDEVLAAGGPEPFIFVMDFANTSAEDYQALADAIGQELGHLDGLLHNAGVLGMRTPLSNYKDQAWQQVMDINLNSNFYLTKALLPYLEASPQGRILFTSSSVGRKGRAYWGAYAISKFAVEGLMQTLADELENTSSIRVNSINPGGTRTAMRAQAYPAEAADKIKSPEMLMGLYVYLMSEDSQAIHGQMIDFQ